MAHPKFSYPGDLVYGAPSYANDRPWARKWVGAAAIVIGQHQDKPNLISRSHYYKVMIDGKECNVLCRDSVKFGIGMPVDVRWDGARWVVVRHPRFNGKY